MNCLTATVSAAYWLFCDRINGELDSSRESSNPNDTIIAKRVEIPSENPSIGNEFYTQNNNSQINTITLDGSRKSEDLWESCVTKTLARLANESSSDEPVFSANRSSIKLTNSTCKNNWSSSDGSSPTSIHGPIKDCREPLNSSDALISELDFKNSNLWKSATQSCLKPLFYVDSRETENHDIDDAGSGEDLLKERIQDKITEFKDQYSEQLRNSQIMDDLALAILNKNEQKAMQKIAELTDERVVAFFVGSLENQYEFLIEWARDRKMYKVVEILSQYASKRPF